MAVNKILKSGQSAKSVSAACLIALVLFLSLLGASPAMHKCLHADADRADHECVVTLFTHGQVDAVSIAPLVTGLVLLVGVLTLLSETFQIPLANYRFSRGRAPPV